MHGRAGQIAWFAEGEGREGREGKARAHLEVQVVNVARPGLARSDLATVSAARARKSGSVPRRRGGTRRPESGADSRADHVAVAPLARKVEPVKALQVCVRHDAGVSLPSCSPSDAPSSSRRVGEHPTLVPLLRLRRELSRNAALPIRQSTELVVEDGAHACERRGGRGRAVVVGWRWGRCHGEERRADGGAVLRGGERLGELGRAARELARASSARAGAGEQRGGESRGGGARLGAGFGRSSRPAWRGRALSWLAKHRKCCILARGCAQGR